MTRSAASQGWDRYPNLLRRPHAPNAGRGRLQVMLRRAFCYAGTDVLTAREIYEFCKTMPQLVEGAPLYRGARWSIIRILEKIAVRIGRAETIGRPWLWRLKSQPSGSEPVGSDSK